MRRSRWLLIPAVASVLVVAAGAGAGITVAAKGTSSRPTRVIACTTRAGVLELELHGHCTKGLVRISLPLTAITGVTGPAGPQGSAGATGLTGSAGPQGIPGPTTTTAPAGSTQRGLYNVDGYEVSGQFLGGSISFPLELTSEPKWVEVPFGGPNPDATHCPGTVEAPSAAPGYLCLYDEFVSNVTTPTGTNLQVQNVNGFGGTVSPFGARLVARANATGEVIVEGSWAVTAP